jgi:hypothetical protein
LLLVRASNAIDKEASLHILLAGGFSFLPLLFYTLFVYAMSVKGLIPILPARFHRVTAVFLVIFIPIIIAFNEVASFIGITHRCESKMLRLRLNGQFLTTRSQVIPSPDPNSMDVIGIGFSTNNNKNLWTIMTSFTLGTLAFFQMFAFSLALLRLARIFVNQRSMETSMLPVDEVYIFKGIAWIVIGLKLGAIETVIGFAPRSFGIALARRIFRMLSRACLVVGTAKGSVDCF